MQNAHPSSGAEGFDEIAADDGDDEDWEVIGASTAGANKKDAASAATQELPADDVAFYRSTFNLSEAPIARETVLLDSTQGTLYVGRRHLGFSGGLLRRYVLVVPLCDVTDLREDSWKLAGRVVSKYIVVQLRNGTAHQITTVAPFGDARAKLFRLLHSVWHSAVEHAISIAENHERSDVLDLMMAPGEQVLNAASAAQQQQAPPSDMRRVKALEEYRRIVQSSRFELVDVFRKGVALQLEGRRIVGSLFVSPVLAFASEKHSMTFVLPLRLVALVETDEPSTITFRMLQDEALVVVLRLANGADSNIASLVKGVWRSEVQRLVVAVPQVSSCEPRVAFGPEMLRDSREFTAEYERDWTIERERLWKRYLARFGRGSAGSLLRNFPFAVGNVRIGWPLVIRNTSSGAADQDFWTLVRDGIPDSLRAEIWTLQSGATMEMISQPGYYARLLEEAKLRPFSATRDIAKDVGRTLPTHPLYQTADGLAALERVLGCYAFHNPRLGYTQSMNFLCAVFLLYMSEEAAFWMMVAVCERITPHSYRKSMVGSVAQLAVLQRLLRARLPTLAAHFDTHDFSISMVATGWFMCIYISFLPWEVCLRILDNFFCCSASIVYRVAMALFVLNEQRLLECDQIEQFLNVLQRRDYHAEEVLSVAHWLATAPQMSDSEVSRMEVEELVRAARDVSSAGEHDLLAQLSGHSCYSDDEVAVLYERFRAALDPDANLGALQFKDFCALLGACVPAWAADHQLALLVFTKCDSDHTGVLEFPAFLSLLAVLERGTTEERLRFCLSLFDGRPSALSRDELRLAIAAFLLLHRVVLADAELDALVQPLVPGDPRAALVDAALQAMRKCGIGADVDSELGSFELIV